MKTDLTQLWKTVKYGMAWGLDSDDDYFVETVQHTVAHIIACSIADDTDDSCPTDACFHLIKCKDFEEFEVEYNKMICPKSRGKNEPQFCPYCGSDKNIVHIGTQNLMNEFSNSGYDEITEWQCHSSKCDGHSFFV